MFRSVEENNLIEAVDVLVHMIEQEIKGGTKLAPGTVIALSNLKMAMEETDKEIEIILKNLQKKQFNDSMN